MNSRAITCFAAALAGQSTVNVENSALGPHCFSDEPAAKGCEVSAEDMNQLWPKHQPKLILYNFYNVPLPVMVNTQKVRMFYSESLAKDLHTI